MEWKKGQIVQSRAGRDTTKLYVVVEVSVDRLWLADGDKWTLALPKGKNPRHINPTNTVLTDAQTESDQALQKALNDYLVCEGANM